MKHRLAITAIVLLLTLWVFGEALPSGRNLAHRDLGVFHYPLLQLVQSEWDAGRWALWNPYENAGAPLLANPVASVFYPPRILVFQWLGLPFPLAFKLYIVLHSILAALTAYAMTRCWGAAPSSAGIGAVAYAFGGIVLFQYCNPVFLVGAAWLPLAAIAIDRSLRLEKPGWGVIFGLILTLQLLGGDPETAYLAVVAALVYAVVLDRRWAPWIGLALASIQAVRHRSAPGALSLDVTLAIVCLVAGLALARRRGPSPKRRLASFAIACGLALALGAVQWLPTAEFVRLSARASPDTPQDCYDWSLAPWRAAELLWPNVSGREFPLNSRWTAALARGASGWIDRASGRFAETLAPRGPSGLRVEDKPWQPSLYLGLVPIVLALTAWRIRGAPPWQSWLAILTLAGLLGAMGRLLGLYPVMIRYLPGFDAFRYPAKLLVWTALGVAGLAAAAVPPIDLRRGRPRRVALGVGGISLIVLVAATAFGSWIRGTLHTVSLVARDSLYGPLRADDAFRAIMLGPVHALAVLLAAAGWTAFCHRARRETWIGIGLVVLTAVDLGLANRWMVATVDQKLLDTASEVVSAVRQDSPTAAESGPPRIHRTAYFFPQRWTETASPKRHEEILAWQRRTAQARLGIPDLAYVVTQGTMELYDYPWFFSPFYSNTADRRVIVYPRRGFDLWGARYLVLPGILVDTDEQRGFRSLLPETSAVRASPPDADEYQILRNDAAMPRAWIVHETIHRPPISGLRARDRVGRMLEMLYPGADALWIEPALEGKVVDPRRVVWIEHPDPVFVASLGTPGASSEGERVRWVSYEADRVEIEAECRARGVLVVSEVLYPGWRLLVDGRPRETLRANRMMRGVALGPGNHRVIFEYRPWTFRVGLWISLTSAALLLAGFAALHLTSRRRLPKPR